jgi:hypothetical protein
MTTRPTPDRFSTLLQFGLELARSGESELRHLTRVIHNPERAVLNWIQYRNQLLETIVNLHSSVEEEQAAEVVSQIRFTVPANFDEAVPVVASNQQISDAMREIENHTELGTCAICQDAIQTHPEGCQLRNCGHHFHDTCILEWFSRSVRCPVCRNDIRDAPDN